MQNFRVWCSFGRSRGLVFREENCKSAMSDFSYIPTNNMVLLWPFIIFYLRLNKSWKKTITGACTFHKNDIFSVQKILWQNIFMYFFPVHRISWAINYIAEFWNAVLWKDRKLSWNCESVLFDSGSSNHVRILTFWNLLDHVIIIETLLNVSKVAVNLVKAKPLYFVQWHFVCQLYFKCWKLTFLIK